MIQGYVVCNENNLNGCLAKMEHQYGLISKNTNWSEYHNSQDAKARYDDLHPRSIGDRWTTDIEQCAETGRWFMNIEVTQEQVDELIDVPTTPVFAFTYKGELDEEGEEIPAPTFMVAVNDDDGNFVEFRTQTICRQQ
jgi:hypothetical protein